jgi:hypothetical protein
MSGVKTTTTTTFRYRQAESDSELPFGIRVASALGISIVADALDYVGAPIFALPVVGDITDAIIVSLLYHITKSKVTVVINATEFIPLIGDFVPTYTISTLLWILNESRKRQKTVRKGQRSSTRADNNNNNNRRNTAARNENLQTRIMRAYAILRSNTK